LGFLEKSPVIDRTTSETMLACRHRAMFAVANFTGEYRRM